MREIELKVDAAAFDAPFAAGYRVGVDYHQRCDGDEDAPPEVFRVEIAYGDETEERAGTVRPGQFLDAFWLWETPAAASAAAADQ